MTSLQQKSPFRLIKERANIESVVALPSTAFLLSWNMFSSTLYIFTGFASMSLERMLTASTTLINSINAQFEADLKHPWAALSNGDLTRLYKLVIFHGVKNINAAIDELESNAIELSHYLDDRNLPYNSEVVKFVASKLKSIERRLVRIGGVRLVSTTENVSGPVHAKVTRRTVKPHIRIATPTRTTPSKRISPDERLPTMMLGEGQPAYPQLHGHEHEHEEHEEPEEHLERAHHGEHISQHKIEVLQDRAPTMMWGPTSQKRKANEEIVPQKEVVPQREIVVSPIHTQPIFTKPAEVSKEEIIEPKEIAETLQLSQENKPKEAAKPKSRKHKKTKSAKSVVWPKVDSSAFVKLAEENRAKELQRSQEIAEAKHQEVTRAWASEGEEEEEVDENVDEYGYAPVKAPAHGHLLPQDVAKEIAKDLVRPHKHLLKVPVTPVNSPAEALTNNPFGDILVEEDVVVSGPETVLQEEEKISKLQEEHLLAHQSKLKKNMLSELLEQVGERLEKVEKRAEENAQAGPWQTAKHTVHVEVEHPVAGPSADVVPAPANNPFAKLDTDTTEDPFSMGLSTM